MNVCIIGGGGPPGKFGRDFSELLRTEGHNVFVVSHKEHGTGDAKQVAADFSDVNSVVIAFKKVTENLEKIDLLLYNSTGNFYPGEITDFHADAIVSETDWIATLRLHAIIPHALSVCALNKMTSGSRIAFMTTGLSMSIPRDNWTDKAGYAGGKAAQNQLMVALAHNNDRGVVCTSIATHFPYGEDEKYKKVFNKIKNYIFEMSSSDNGKIKYISEHGPE